MTSIQWMIDELIKKNTGKVGNEYIEIFEQAKEMHKQEIIDAANKLLYHGPGPGNTAAEKYYQETFVSKGSDEQYILNEATNRYVIEDEIEAFIQGANWMQEQLKTK